MRNIVQVFFEDISGMHEERKGSSIAKDRDSWPFGIPMDTVDTKRTAVQDEVSECTRNNNNNTFALTAPDSGP
jgi:hypothetical protein